MTKVNIVPIKPSGLPEWASEHLRRHLGMHVRVVNGHVVTRGRMKEAILLNTTEGAALLSKSRFGAPTLVRLALPGQRFAFTCVDCAERIELVDAETPRPFYCTRCARHYALSREGDSYVLFTAMDEATPASSPGGPGWTRLDPGQPMAREVQRRPVAPRKATAKSKPKPQAQRRPVSPRKAAAKPKPKPKPQAQRPQRVPPKDGGPFRYKGYTLHTRHVDLKNGRRQRIYFFAKGTNRNATPSRKPSGFQVVETKTGLPVLRRARNGTAPVRAAAGKREKRVEPRCAARTDDGASCKNTSRKGSKYCAAHHDYRRVASPAKRAVRPAKEKRYEAQCQGLTEGGKQCRNSSRKGSKYCVSHFGYRPPRVAATRGRGKDTKPSVKGAEDTRPSHRKVAAKPGSRRVQPRAE